MWRKLIFLIVLLAALWGGAWYAIAFATRAGIDNWANMRRAEGWTVRTNAQTQSGFPMAVQSRIEGLTLDHRAGGFASQTPVVNVQVALSKPFSPSIVLPAQTIVLARPNARADWSIQGADATVRINPGLMLELKRADLVLLPWTLGGPQGPILTAQGSHADMAQDSADANVYHFSFSIENLAAAQTLRDLLALPDAWPEAFDAFSAKVTVEFDRPQDRTSIPGDRPQPRRVHLRRAAIKWGAIELAAEAELKIDAEGIPQGKLSLSAENWVQMLDLAQATGALDAGARNQIENALAIVARLNGNEANIDIDVTFERGRMSMGLIPLGPAPRIYLQ